MEKGKKNGMNPSVRNGEIHSLKKLSLFDQ